jgi:hypothetical protein
VSVDYGTAVAEGRRLLTRSEEDQWRLAELTFDVVEAGSTRMAWASDVGISRSHAGRLYHIWRRWGDVRTDTRPRFLDAYETIKRAGAEDDDAELVNAGEINRIQRERQEPTRHEDRVEMATKLLADPEVVKGVLETPARARSEIHTQIHEQNAQQRAKAKETAGRKREATAIPISAAMSTMAIKIDEWAFALAGLYGDLDELPEGPWTDSLARSVDHLRYEAQRWLDKLTREDAEVIDLEPIKRGIAG